MRFIIVVALILTVAACRQQPNVPLPARGTPVSADCASLPAGDRYLPVGTAGPTRHQDEVNRAFAASLLRAGSMSSLSCGDGPDESYRLVWSPESRSSLIVQLAKMDQRWSLTATEFTHPKDGDRTVPLRTVERALSPEEANQIESLVNQIALWQQPGWVKDDIGGDFWVIEGRRLQGYHVIFRSSSVVDDRVRNFGRHLVGLSGIDSEIGER